MTIKAYLIIYTGGNKNSFLYNVWLWTDLEGDKTKSDFIPWRPA